MVSPLIPLATLRASTETYSSEEVLKRVFPLEIWKATVDNGCGGGLAKIAKKFFIYLGGANSQNGGGK